MGFFNRRRSSERRGPGLFSNVGVPLTLTNLVIFVILTLVLIQAIGLLFNLANVTLGPVFVLISIGMAAALSIALFKKISDGLPLDAKDVYAVLLTVVIALFLMFFLRDFVPEVFRQSILSIQSFIGF